MIDMERERRERAALADLERMTTLRMDVDLPATATQAEILAAVAALNADPKVTARQRNAHTCLRLGYPSALCVGK